MRKPHLSSFRRHVDDDRHVVPILVQVDEPPVDVQGLEGEDVGRLLGVGHAAELQHGDAMALGLLNQDWKTLLGLLRVCEIR